jgi:predicted O-methyltransferase YrrM
VFTFGEERRARLTPSRGEESTIRREIARSVNRLGYVARAAKAVATQPYEGIERTLERLAEWRDRRRPPWRYETTSACEEAVHAMVGVPWPCEERPEFEKVWRATLEDLGARGSRIGRGQFGGWDDGDARLASLAWCLTRHGRPERIIETGVARGITTRVLLEALERNGSGHLWSIDLPPLLERGLADEVAIAVQPRLHERWTLLRGSSRRLLPDLMGRLGSVDLFLHDSMHTARNVRFELDHVWPTLRAGGVVLIDDVEKTVAVRDFLRARPATPAVISPSADGRVLIGTLVKSGDADRPLPHSFVEDTSRHSEGRL